jgi:RecA/RadA recombinase
MELSSIIKELNKNFKATKITTLDKAESFKLKRMFSGSLVVDSLLNGGWAYKRRHMLYASKSAGKNALLYQTVSYNQRLCRHCHKILSEFYNNEQDRHAMFLKRILNIEECKCDNAEGKKFIIIDFEKSLSIEDASVDIIRNICDKKTGEQIDDLIFDEKELLLSTLQVKENLLEEEKAVIKSIEKWMKGLNIEVNSIIKEATKDYLIKCGILIDRLHVTDPEDIEEATEIIGPLIRGNDMDGIILDSIQTAIPRYVKERDSANATIGVEGKSNALFLRLMCSAFAAKDLTMESEAYKPAFFATSQMRVGLGAYIVKDSYSGGRAWEHLADVILELKREHFVKADGTEAKFQDEFFGQKTRIRVEKSKLSAPGDMMEYEYYFRDGDMFGTGQIDHIAEIVYLGIQKGVIERAGAYYKITTGDTFQGMNKLVDYCRNEPEFVSKVYKQIKK